MTLTEYGCYGYLMVKGSSLRSGKSWSQRFVKLNGDLLTIATNSTLSSIKEQIPIFQSGLKLIINSKDNKSFSLLFSKTQRSIQFSCLSQSELLVWQKAFKEASKDKHKVSLDSIEIIKAICNGANTSVFLAKLYSGINSKDNTGNTKDNLVAVKRTNNLHEYKTEVFALSTLSKTLNNPFVVELKYNFQFNDEYYMILEYEKAGDLFDRLDYEVTQRDSKIYSSELLCALESCHSQGIIYGDLKPENILLGSDGHLKLTDFGLAKCNNKIQSKIDQLVFDESANQELEIIKTKGFSIPCNSLAQPPIFAQYQRYSYSFENPLDSSKYETPDANARIGSMNNLNDSDLNSLSLRSTKTKSRNICDGELSIGFAGTVEYAAPEVINCQAPTEKADVWSYGVVIYELLYNRKPFNGNNRMELIHSITNDILEFPEEAKADEIEMLTATMEKDPAKRPSFQSLKEFEFFRQIDWECLWDKKYQTDFLPEDIAGPEFENEIIIT